VTRTKFNTFSGWFHVRVGTAPPSSVEITNQFSDSKLEVRENHEITIDCAARNSRPVSRILWFRGNTEINPGEYTNRLYNIISRTDVNRIKTREHAGDSWTVYYVVAPVVVVCPRKDKLLSFVDRVFPQIRNAYTCITVIKRFVKTSVLLDDVFLSRLIQNASWWSPDHGKTRVLKYIYNVMVPKLCYDSKWNIDKRDVWTWPHACSRF